MQYQVSKMSNALIPSVPLQLYGFDDNEFQMQNMDFSMQKVNVNGFCGEPKLSSNVRTPYLSYQPANTSTSDEQARNKYKLPVAQFESGMKNARKAEMNEAWFQKKRKMNVEQIHHPARRSQKLGDKITALQKLVSPYGKTDTASVLQEASAYIKLLHEQIQNMTSSSYGSVAHPQLGLRSKGLCLLPLSFIQQLTKEDIHHHH